MRSRYNLQTIGNSLNKLLLLFVGLFFTSFMATAGVLSIEATTGNQKKTQQFATTRIPLDPSVSLAQVIEFLDYRSHYNPNTKILQTYFTNHQVKIQEDNPFIVVQSLIKPSDITTIQLPMAISAGPGDYYIPVRTLHHLLKTVIDGEVTLSKDLEKLIISKRIFDLNRLGIEEKSNGTLIRFPLLKKLEDFENHQDANGNNYLTLVNIKGDIDGINQTERRGLVNDILAKQLPNGTLQIIIRVNPKNVAGIDFEYVEKTQELFMNIRGSAASQQIQSETVSLPINNNLHVKEKWSLDVIVLDAGHGGRDPGTIGKGKTQEKDVTLAVVKKLGALIKKHFPEIKVVYTRQDDRYIDLIKRGRIANENKGKLFISLHCNSNVKKTANGVDAYILGLHKSDEALEVSKRENAVILTEEDQHAYKNFTEENLIMLTMAQSAFLSLSEELALSVATNIEKKTSIKNRGVKQAGFMVLWTPSMPAILVEMGFLSNPNEEKLLKSDKTQQQIAEAVLQAIRDYKDNYEKNLGLN